MTFHLKAAAVAALVAAGAGSAHANFIFGNPSSFGNGTVSFVAIDNGGNVSLVADLGVQMAGFLPAFSQTLGAGALSAAGTTAVWNFASNTYTLNGAAVTGNTFNWSPVASFLSNSNVTANGYQWGVVSSDTVSSTTVSATNVIRGQGVLFTGNPDFEIDTTFSGFGTTSGHIANSTGNVNNYYADNNNTGTHSTTVKGASVTNVGSTAFLGSTLAQNNIGDFGGGQFGNNNFLVDVGTVSYFNWAQAAPTASIWSIGQTVTQGALSQSPATFTWNPANSTLTYFIAPIPEPATYGLLLAGLAGVGFVARRRSLR